MIRYAPLAFALAASLLTAACTRPTEPPRPDTSPAPESTASPGALLAAPPADSAGPAAEGSPALEPAPSGPIPVPVTSAIALAGAEPSPLSFDQPVVVDPAVQFQVEVAVPLVDARLALLDSADAMIAAVESHEIGASWSRFTLLPDAPLRPGSSYSLRLDGAAEREAHDSEGRTYQITAWDVRIAGEPPPPEKPASAPTKRRR